MTDSRPDNFVLYDGECPVCGAYIALARLRELRPDLQVLDARHEPSLVAAMRADGFDVNDSILVGLGSRVYSGAAATRLISQLGSDNPLMRRAALYAIGGAPWSDALYPWLRAMRNGLLRVLGRDQIG
jgi:predicted DCC family thiol-disulfide oxidoreductase YuxK